MVVVQSSSRYPDESQSTVCRKYFVWKDAHPGKLPTCSRSFMPGAGDEGLDGLTHVVLNQSAHLIQFAVLASPYRHYGRQEDPADLQLFHIRDIWKVVDGG